ncbi:Bug family tripartite tricarboxylate transporter substrate binding protein [Candidimonas nitroreducens]|uniref:LacI family transcriptional regulator n=1 Tax=Candidimonas nitroreducens TaxID=683354 RepID=A0A225MG40_9BURK|nr:tripartite tricarboxylate transporter substrate binding protein [Candidimonas nitroreducens]OWT60225.1 LacI family transcriptional regulator [Candidimonas nitroreducens]
MSKAAQAVTSFFSTLLKRRHPPGGHRPRAGTRPLACAAVALAACTAGASAPAANWPDHPVYMVVPFVAGGATDNIGRALAMRLGAIWKQSVVVVNKPGAAGMIGAEYVARADPDGYTLLLASGSMFTVNPYIYTHMPYKLSDFAPISNVATGPMVVAVRPSLPVKTLQQLIDYAKQHPGKVNFGSAGVGSQVHMAAEKLAAAANLNVMHVPYKGEAAAYADLMAGHIDFVVGNIAALAPLVASGRIRALAVTGEHRAKMLPDVPTVAEAGYPQIQVHGWFGLLAPAKTPPALVQAIQRDVAKALANPDTVRNLEAQGSTPAPTSPQQLTQLIKTESVMWSKVVHDRKLKAN